MMAWCSLGALGANGSVHIIVVVVAVGAIVNQGFTRRIIVYLIPVN